MKLHGFQKKIFIFFSIIISILIVSLLWSKITFPLNNTNGAKGFLVSEGYNPINDTIRYIFFISFPITVFLLLNIFINNKKINIKELLFEKVEKIETIKRNSSILTITFILIFFIFIEFFSLTFAVSNLDHMHDATFLAPAQNYLSSKNLWTSSYLVHGSADIFYPVLMWKILGVESIGAARSFSIFVILFIKLLSVLLSYQLTKILKLSDGAKILFFTTLSLIIISMSRYSLIPSGYYLSPRDIFIILFLIFFIELFIYSKFRSLFIILICLVSTISALFNIDIGIYLNFTLIFYFIYLLIIKNYKDFLLIACSLIIFWLIAIETIGLEEFKAFLINTKAIISSFDLMQGLKYPEPFFSIANDPNGARATRGIIFQLTAGLFVINYLIENKSKILKSKKVLFIFLFFLSFVMYKNALSRSDSGHIRMSGELPILINIFFILNYFLIFLEKKVIDKKMFNSQILTTLSIVFLIFYYINNHNNFSVSNIKNYKSNFLSYINLEDRKFLSEKTINQVNYYREISKNDNCILNITSELDAITYLLKKPSCTKYWSAWLTSPTLIQKDYIKKIEKIKPEYIIYEPRGAYFDGLQLYQRIELINDYLISNYKKHNQLDNFLILKKNE